MAQATKISVQQEVKVSVQEVKIAKHEVKQVSTQEIRQEKKVIAHGRVEVKAVSGPPDLDEAIKAIFWKTDTDRSGTLSRLELRGMLTNNGYRLSDQHFERIFSDADSNNDNEIGFDEYLMSMGKTPAEVHKQALYRVQFKQYDKDSNGRLSKDEFQAVFQALGSTKTKEEVDALFKSIDKDGSGEIEYEEYLKHMVDKM